MKALIIIFLTSLFTSVSIADTNLVTCPEWRSKQKIYVDHSKKAEILKPEAPVGFIHLYRAMAAILGSKRMSGELNEALEKSGYGDLFDVLMSMNSRGGFPDDFIDAVKRFHNSKAFNMENEMYVIDVNNQEMLAKFRRSYCK